jgi:hypothetical protein
MPMHVITAELLSFEPVFDVRWVKMEREKLGLAEDQSIPLQITGDSELVDSAGNPVGKMIDVLRAGEKDAGIKEGEVDVSYPYQEATFIKTGGASFPLLKVNEVRMKFKVHHLTQETIFDGGRLVKFILAKP